MNSHPYRTAERAAERREDGSRIEELALALVLVASGAIGVAIGALQPHENATELVVGAFLILLGVSTVARRKRA